MKPKLSMTDKLYELVKRLVQVILPASATLYYTMAKIWDLPAPEQVVGSIVAITTFLGVCLGLSSKSYNAGDNAFGDDDANKLKVKVHT